MVGNSKNIENVKVVHPSSKDAFMKVLVGEDQGWDNHVMRVLTVKEGGFTPKHAHDWPHINYMIKGTGVLMINGVDHPVEEGSYAYVPSNALHQFRNAGKGEFQFICIVPSKGHY